MVSEESLFIGFDLSTQQLKAIVIQSNLTLIHEIKVEFDGDLPHYGTENGVLTHQDEGEIFAPVAMWLEAVDLVLNRLRKEGLDFSRVAAISGAGMQHGIVCWRRNTAAAALAELDPEKGLTEQLHGPEQAMAFTNRFSPNWQDASTQSQCNMFDACFGNPNALAEVTGSKVHHRFSGPQIMRFRERNPEAYRDTGRISLVSSFLASIFLGRIAPIDVSDVCGMNLWNIISGEWCEPLLKVAAGDTGAEDLKAKLGDISRDGGRSYGALSKYFVSRYGFNKKCVIIPFTGDNPATMLALPLRASDAIVSLGTSTTFLMSTSEYRPDPSYHIMNHPTTNGLYMFMLCYKNGSLAREKARDNLNSSLKIEGHTWDAFDECASLSPPLHNDPSSSSADMFKMGIFFPRPEIVPNVSAGTWRFLYEPKRKWLEELDAEAKEGEERHENEHNVWGGSETDVRTIVESQFLSLRLRSANVVRPQQTLNGTKIPPQPRRIYVVGGGSLNSVITDICGQVLGGSEGIYRLHIGSNACALGAAYKAAWGFGREKDQTFEKFIEGRWDEKRFAERVAEGYREGLYETYGEALKGFAAMEKLIEEREEASRI